MACSSMNIKSLFKLSDGNDQEEQSIDFIFVNCRAYAYYVLQYLLFFLAILYEYFQYLYHFSFYKLHVEQSCIAKRDLKF